MEIKIDTKRDSPEEIRKMIQFLETFIASSDNMSTNSPSVTESESVPSGAFNMFDNGPIETSSEEKKEDSDDEKIIFEY